MIQFQKQMFTRTKSFFADVTKANNYATDNLLSSKTKEISHLCAGNDMCYHFLEPASLYFANIKSFTGYKSVVRVYHFRLNHEQLSHVIGVRSVI